MEDYSNWILTVLLLASVRLGWEIASAGYTRAEARTFVRLWRQHCSTRTGQCLPTPILIRHITTGRMWWIAFIPIVNYCFWVLLKSEQPVLWLVILLLEYVLVVSATRQMRPLYLAGWGDFLKLSDPSLRMFEGCIKLQFDVRQDGRYSLVLCDSAADGDTTFVVRVSAELAAENPLLIRFVDTAVVMRFFYRPDPAKGRLGDVTSGQLVGIQHQPDTELPGDDDMSLPVLEQRVTAN